MIPLHLRQPATLDEIEALTADGVDPRHATEMRDLAEDIGARASTPAIQARAWRLMHRIDGVVKGWYDAVREGRKIAVDPDGEVVSADDDFDPARDSSGRFPVGPGHWTILGG